MAICVVLCVSTDHNTEGEIPCLKNPLQTLFTPRKTLHYHYTIDTMLLDWVAVKKKKNPRKFCALTIILPHDALCTLFLLHQSGNIVS